MICPGILVFWCISVYDRIINRNVRRYLLVLAGLMMLLMFSGILRYTVFLRVPPVGRWCWYGCFVSMILTAQFSLFAVKYAGRPEDCRIPKKWRLMYIPSLVLIAGILTNDLHQQAFRFHQNYETGWDECRCGVLCYAAVIWIFSCIALMIAEVAKRSREPGMKKKVWMPAAVAGAGVLYIIFCTVDGELSGFTGITAAFCFTIAAVWENCRKTGLIRSNTRCEELLKYSELGAAVADNDYRVYYRSDDAFHLTEEQMKMTEEAPLMLNGGIRVSSSEIRGGRVLWQEDLSELMTVLEELEKLREELKESNRISMQNYQMARHVRALAEKSRLHDKLHNETSRQLSLLNDLLGRLTDTEDAGEKRELLRRIAVVGAYLKRRSNLILVNEQEGMIREEELELSIKEMMKNLELTGIDCACMIQLDKDLSAPAAMELFDFYEYVVENAFDGLSCLLARFFLRDNSFFACIDVVCDLDLTMLQSDRISVSITDENCYTLSFRAEGGCR